MCHNRQIEKYRPLEAILKKKKYFLSIYKFQTYIENGRVAMNQSFGEDGEVETRNKIYGTTDIYNQNQPFVSNTRGLSAVDGCGWPEAQKNEGRWFGFDKKV